MVRRALIIFCIILWPAAAVYADQDTLIVAAAANLASSLPAIHGAFELCYPDVSVKVVTGSSGALTAQILNGAPFDVFLSADMSYPEKIYQQGGAPAAPELYAEGVLVLVSPRKGPAATVEEFILNTTGPVIIPNPRVAPYGKAAVQFLESAGLYDIIEPRIAYTENITQTVRMILTTEGIGFISKSALLSLEKNKRGYRSYTSFEMEPGRYDPIRQGCIVTGFGNTNPWARVYVDFLIRGDGRQLLQKLGYRVEEQ